VRAAARVGRARRALVTTLLVASLLRALATALALLLGFGILDLLAPLPLAIRGIVAPAAAIGGLLVLALCISRGRHAFQLTRVALYVEERVPALEFALVTALGGAGLGTEALEGVADRAVPEGFLRRPLARVILVALALLLVSLAGWATLPATIRARILTPVAGDVLLASRVGAPAASRLAPLVVRVDPPGYAGRPARMLEDPVTVVGLPGSRIELRGRGANLGALDSLVALLGNQILRVSAVGDEWTVSLRMPQTAIALRLADRGFARVLALEPFPDQPPAVTLTAPSRDTTYLLPRGRLALAGTAQDDIGLVRAEFELMHTTGSGERFDIRRITLGAVSPGGATAAALRATILLDTMRLGPGDVLHMRVVARDGNDVSGPGEGASDTRTIRIADPRARDTVQVIPAAVAALDTTMLSERMLVIRAETLLVQRRRIGAPAFESRSRVLGQQQGMLRERVEAIIAELETATEVGFTGKTEASVILGEAAAAMKLAQRDLAEVRVKEALPAMYRALKSLEKLRNSERLYLRGVFPKLVVDLDKIRLKGTDKAGVGARDPRPPLPDSRAALLDRLDRVLPLVARGGAGLRDSLILIRVDALTVAPDAAPALARAIDAIGAGRSPAPLLAAARRTLLRTAEAVPGLSPWRSAP